MKKFTFFFLFAVAAAARAEFVCVNTSNIIVLQKTRCLAPMKEATKQQASSAMGERARLMAPVGQQKPKEAFDPYNLQFDPKNEAIALRLSGKSPDRGTVWEPLYKLPPER